MTAQEQSEEIARILNEYPNLTKDMKTFLSLVEKIPGVKDRRGGLAMYVPGWVIRCSIIRGEA